MTRYLSLALKLALLAMLTLFAVTGAQAQTVTVKFPKGSSGTTIEGSIKGNQSIKYRVGLSAGQTLSVQLDTSNSSNYFNVTAPGASEALYNSSISGNGTSFVVPSSGDYIISVYLMRNAARRNETANYQLTLYVEGRAAAPQQKPRPRPVAPRPSAASDAISTGQMPRFCAGEASAKYGVRPQDITTNIAFKSGNNYVVQGYFDTSNGSSTFFNCYFGLDGSYLSIS